MKVVTESSSGSVSEVVVQAVTRICHNVRKIEGVFEVPERQVNTMKYHWGEYNVLRDSGPGRVEHGMEADDELGDEYLTYAKKVT